MKKIPLSKTGKKYKGMYEALVDDDVFEEVNQYSWTYDSRGYAQRSDHSTGKQKTVRLHRFIWELKNGSIPKGLDVEHWDENGLNDQINNLRLATRSENMCNRTKLKNNTSGIKGIYKHVYKKLLKNGTEKEYIKWTAEIRKDKGEGRKTYAKDFPYTAEGFESAKEWIKQNSLELHKEFSIYNKPNKNK